MAAFKPASFTNQGNVLNQVGGNQNVQGNINVYNESRELLYNLPWVEDAAFNSYSVQHDPMCMHGTRVELLNQIMLWSNNPDEKCLFWLNGMAGTGKSTIARTIARVFHEQGRLGASFFFSRGQGDRGHAAKFFTSIARCLADLIPAMRDKINEAIVKHSSIARQALRDQWTYLIYEPLTKLKCDQNQSKALTIVIDALDECESDDDVRAILQIITEAKSLNTIRLSIFITSRPETPIRLGFRMMDQIIYLCRFIGDLADPEGPEERLKLVLDGDSHAQSSTKALDEIYTQVLRNSIKKNDEDSKRKLRENFRCVVGSIVILFDVLSIPALAMLLSISEGKVITSLRFLHSLIDIPDDFNSPVRLLHPSFRDFLLDSQRCLGQSFWINKEKAHSNLARGCLEIMAKTLKRNICNLRTPGAAPNETESKLPAHMQYACLYWFDHFNQSDHVWQKNIDLFDHDQVYQFFQENFLNWLEAMSLMGKISEGAAIITRFESMLEPDKHDTLYAIVHDAKRFVLYNHSVIEKAPLQVYASALVFSPKQSIIKNCYLNQLPSWIIRHPVTENHWSSALQTLEGHSELVNVVAFSPNGKQLASASNDGTVLLWDAALGASRRTLNGHSDWVKAIAFSPDSKQLASASHDGTVRLWDVASGASLGTLKGHSKSVWAVAFSPDGKLLASASNDCTVRIWDPALSVSWRTLKGHLRSVNAVAFSPDGKQLASASADETVRLWDAVTGASQGKLKGHSSCVSAIAYSPNSKQLASSSNDSTVRLWDVASGATRRALKGHSKKVTAIAFSPNGKQLASTSADCMVRLWDAATGASRGTLEGHSKSVWAVAFSSDGKLASASDDGTVRFWDAASGASRGTLEGHSSRVRAVAFSPDGKQLASGSTNGMVRLWDAATKASRGTLEGHSSRVSVVAFSPDGKQLASASDDCQVRLWDTAAGASRQTLEGLSRSVDAVAFSPDGKQLVCSSVDGTARLWDVASGWPIRDLIEERVSTLSLLPYRRLPTINHTESYIPVSRPSSWFIRRNWLTWNDHKALWLPVEFRPSCLWAEHGNLFVMGHSSGQITFLELAKIVDLPELQSYRAC